MHCFILVIEPVLRLPLRYSFRRALAPPLAAACVPRRGRARATPQGPLLPLLWRIARTSTGLWSPATTSPETLPPPLGSSFASPQPDPLRLRDPIRPVDFLRGRISPSPQILVIFMHFASHHNSLIVAPIRACSISKCSSRRVHNFISLHHFHLSSY